jgi:hypothetical protein
VSELKVTPVQDTESSWVEQETTRCQPLKSGFSLGGQFTAGVSSTVCLTLSLLSEAEGDYWPPETSEASAEPDVGQVQASQAWELTLRPGAS